MEVYASNQGTRGEGVNEGWKLFQDARYGQRGKVIADFLGASVFQTAAVVNWGILFFYPHFTPPEWNERWSLNEGLKGAEILLN